MCLKQLCPALDPQRRGNKVMEGTSKYQKWVGLKERGGLPEGNRVLQGAGCWMWFFWDCKVTKETCKVSEGCLRI